MHAKHANHAKVTGKRDRSASEATYLWEGVGMIGVGMACAYCYLYPALVLLQQGAPGESLGKDGMLGIGILPTAIGFGLLYGFGGRWAADKLGPMQRPSRLGNLLAFLFILLGGALMIWIDHELMLRS